MGGGYGPKALIRFPIIDFFRDRIVRLDGHNSDRHLPRQTWDEHGHILVDDAGVLSEEPLEFPAAQKAYGVSDRYVPWSLDGVPDQLVVD